MSSLRMRELELERELELRRARTDFVSFCRYVTPEFQSNWHIEEIARAINDIAFGDLRRLYLAMPPQHGKSTLLSVHATAFFLGVSGNTRILAASYAASLSMSLNRQVQRLMETELYVRVFPATRLAGAQQTKDQAVLRTQNAFEIAGHKGYLRSTGAMGSHTGFAGDIIIIDDAHKNSADADSQVIRERTWAWFQTVMLTRLQKKGALICLGTRWRQDDFLSQILEMAQAKDASPQWRVISLPAIAERPIAAYDKRKEGEALWSARFDVKTLNERRAALGERQFSALYQQNPLPSENAYVKPEWIQRYDVLPSDVTDYTLSVDLTFKDTGDYNAFSVWARKGPNHYLIEMIEKRMLFNDQLHMMRALCGKYPQMQVKLVEDTANGTALLATLRQQIPGLVAVRPKTSKELRLQAVSPMFEAGNVFVPAKAPWVDSFVTQLCAFPSAAHDDQVDACTQYLMRAQQQTFDFSRIYGISLGRDEAPAWR